MLRMNWLVFGIFITFIFDLVVYNPIDIRITVFYLIHTS
jgi:hypothetical protein